MQSTFDIDLVLIELFWRTKLVNVFEVFLLTKTSRLKDQLRRTEGKVKSLSVEVGSKSAELESTRSDMLLSY